MIEPFRGHELDAHYLGYFECFNRQLFFEAHEVLEELWLAEGNGQNYCFYKGLIQLAGAFVHLQKDRLGPAAALFRLAEANLKSYPAVYERLDLDAALKLIQQWQQRLEGVQFGTRPLASTHKPKLELQVGF